MVEIKTVNIESADAKTLIAELNQELVDITGDDGTAHFKEADVAESGSVFLIGYLDHVPYSCGAIRKMDGQSGEIKRVYARKNSCGMGTSLLKALEQNAYCLTKTILT